MNRFKLTLVMLLTLTQSSLLFAHPGHGSSDTTNPEGILHYLTEPVHLIPFIAVAVFTASIIVGRKMLQRSRAQKQKSTTLPPHRRN